MPDAPKAASGWQSNRPEYGRSAVGRLGRVNLALHSPVPPSYHRLWKVVQRLKSRAEFQAVLAGRTVSKTVHFALHQSVMDQALSGLGVAGASNLRLGVMVAKRWAKRAVTRNMIKRQAYTVFSGVVLPPADYVVRLRSEFSKVNFVSATSTTLKSAVRQELHQLIGTAHSAAHQGLQGLRHTPSGQTLP